MQTTISCAFKNLRGVDPFSKAKKSHKLNEFPLVVYNNTSNIHHLSNKISRFSSPHTFFFRIFVVCWHEILTHYMFKTCIIAFLSSYMFLQIVKLRYYELFPSIDLITNLATHHVKFRVTRQNYFSPRMFCSPHLLKNLIQFPWFLLFTFLLWFW